MLTIVYCKDGEPVDDFEWEDWLNTVLNDTDFLSGKDVEYAVSTSLPIHALRLAVVKGKLPHTKVQIKYEGQTLRMNEYGRIDPYPKGFCNQITNIVEKVVLETIKKHKKSDGDKDKKYP